MDNLNVLLEIFKTYGVSGLLLIVLIYILVKGQLTFRYPGTWKKD